MVKIQEIKRKNGTTVHTVYLPEDMIAALGWTKGSEIKCDMNENGIYLFRVN